MTTQVIETGNSSAQFSLGVGSYEVTAVAGKYTTITQQFDIDQSDIESGTKTINLGAMTLGTHTFNVTVNSSDEGEFTVMLKKGSDEVATNQTLNKQTSFTITASDATETPENYTITVSRDGYKTVTQDVDATVAEFRLSGNESVSIGAGSNVMTLTVVVTAAAPVTVSVE